MTATQRPPIHVLNSAVGSPDQAHILKRVLLNPHAKAKPWCQPHCPLTYFFQGKQTSPRGLGKRVAVLERRSSERFDRFHVKSGPRCGAGTDQWEGTEEKKRRGVGSLSRGQAPVITTVSSPIPHSSSFSPARSDGAVDYRSPAPSAQSFRLGKSTTSLHHQRNRVFFFCTIPALMHNLYRI